MGISSEEDITVLGSIPIELDKNEILNRLAIGKVENKRAEITSLIEMSVGLIEPKAVYLFTRLVRVQTGHIVLTNGYTLQSSVLADKLTCGQEVAVYVATIGAMLEEKASKLGKKNLFHAFVLERIGDYAVGKVVGHIMSRVGERLGISLSNFSPGEGSGELFAISQQQRLFDMLKPLERIGVLLNQGFLMIPRKSSSGILASTAKEYVACEHCPRERCDSRRRRFVGNYDDDISRNRRNVQAMI